MWLFNATPKKKRIELICFIRLTIENFGSVLLGTELPASTRLPHEFWGEIARTRENFRINYFSLEVLNLPAALADIDPPPKQKSGLSEEF